MTFCLVPGGTYRTGLAASDIKASRMMGR